MSMHDFTCGCPDCDVRLSLEQAQERGYFDEPATQSSHYGYYTRDDGEILGSLGYFCAAHETQGARFPCCGLAMPRWETVENPSMPQSTAERQQAFKQAMKEAGMVRLEAWVTKEQREKFRQLGGDEWLRKRIDAAKQQSDKR